VCLLDFVKYLDKMLNGLNNMFIKPCAKIKPVLKSKLAGGLNGMP
jgi:hypothetical protein